MVLTLTVAIGMDGVEVGVIVGVSVGKGVLLGMSVMTGAAVVMAKTSAVTLAATSASVVAVPGDCDGRLQADNPRMMMKPKMKNFFVMVM